MTAASLNGSWTSNQAKLWFKAFVKLALATTLAVSFSAAQCQELTKLQVEIEQARRDSKGLAPNSIVDVICDERTRVSVTTAARKDGIQEPKDFAVALSVLWCLWDQPRTVMKAQTLPRLKLPFVAVSAEGRTHKRRSSAAITRWLDEVGQIGTSPFDFNTTISHGGTKIFISASREGGFDEYTLILNKGRWKLSRFLNGGAC
jgi:hypothetical protein